MSLTAIIIRHINQSLSNCTQAVESTRRGILDVELHYSEIKHILQLMDWTAVEVSVFIFLLTTVSTEFNQHSRAVKIPSNSVWNPIPKAI
jgi:hypothetical protein